MNNAMKDRLKRLDSLVRVAALLIMVATIFLWMLTGCVGMSGPCSAALDMQTRIGTLQCEGNGKAQVFAPSETIEKLTPMVVEKPPPWPAEPNLKPIVPEPPPDPPPEPASAP